MFGFFYQLSTTMQKKLIESQEYSFYRHIFCGIREDDFAFLYSKKGSRPNAPVNTMVAVLFLMQLKNWTYEKLFEGIKFNLLTKAALGLNRLEEKPFYAASLFNFLNRLNNHFIKTGENLLEWGFDSLTQQQIEELEIKTGIQSTDSFLAASNIRNYTRIQLLVELVIRIWRVLSESDKQRFSMQFSPMW